ncbi:hypothetical protein NUW54_g2935 [Trametes sanguinea]|uniref:Uncharacterized protein n=1 Tax=Trametes sanguinea TaxID=158606 RepID=A0ACC1Q4R0_9APHY|nr:hypothetical protein NUW54_g2935 [Trametes sanguinea]
MRKPDPPFPSFTLAMSQWNDSMRLPSYRESLVVRYHPYPRKERKPAERFMVSSLSATRRQPSSSELQDKQTVDYRYNGATQNPENPGEAATPPDASGAIDATDAIDEVASNLDRALNRGVEEGEEGLKPKRRRSLTSLIIDLAIAVIGSYRSSRVGKKRLSVAKDE